MTRVWCCLILVAFTAAGCSEPRKDSADAVEKPIKTAASAITPQASALAAPDLHPDAASAESLYFAGKYDTARAMWKRSLDARAVRADSAQQATILMWLGLAAWRLGDYSDSRAMGEKSLALKQRLRLTSELSRSYNALGLLARDEGRLRDAASLFRRANETASAVHDTAGINRAAANLALVQLDLGEFNEAREGFVTARTAGRALGDARLEANSLNNLAMLTIRLGDPAGAIPMLREAVVLYDSIDYATGYQNAIGQLATAYDQLGNPQQALLLLDSATRMAKSQGLKQEEASNLRLLGEIYQSTGDHAHALEYLGRARELSTSLSLTQETGIALRAEARSYVATGRTDLAQRKLAQALEIHRGQKAVFEELTDLLLLAELSASAGSTDVALRYVAAARTVADRLGAATGRGDLALVEARIAITRSNWREAVAVLSRARDDIRRARYAGAWESNALRAKAYKGMGLLDSAVAAGKLAVRDVESIRANIGSAGLRTTFISDRASVYGDLVITLLQLGRTSEAFEVADAARGRALLEHLAQARLQVSSRGKPIGSLLEAEALLRQIDQMTLLLREADQIPRRERSVADEERIGELAQRLTNAESRYAALLTRTQSALSREAVLLAASSPGAAHISRSLAENEALIEYLVTADRVVAFVVRRNGIRALSVPVSEADISSRVRIARGRAGNRTALAIADESVFRTLHDLLFSDLEKSGMLRGATRLIIVPHAALAYLPFGALINGRTGRTLSDSYAILHLPSARSLATLRSSRVPMNGNASLVLAPFPSSLPATREEAKSIRSAVRGTRALLGEAASEGAFRRAVVEPTVVHFATHGRLNVQNPLFSRIELARPRASAVTLEDDGGLNAHELLTMRLASPLVFLSGCETGVGAAWSTDFARGEDYATLAQAFLYSGAQNVIATLWRIDDEGAAFFASRFYRWLRTLPPPEALAAAQGDMRRDERYKAPYYWAAYQLTGGGDRVVVKKPWPIPFNN
ncbi:MAG TPA: CHAT domain-containing protein [Gemmatimonadaceae bacterium]|nr:CHAT domain-containing protein [Gemmatimonadaceae bacterium]